MTINWSWPKVTALTVVQAAAHTALGLLAADKLSVLSVNWEQVLAASGGAGLVALLSAVVAYQLPAGPATAAVSASVSAAQDAAVAQAAPTFTVGDATEARGAS